MRSLLVCAVLSAVAFVVAPAGAEEKKKAPAFDEKAAMEAVMKAGTPGEAHKKLGALVGTWDLTVKMWMDPSKSAEESRATSEIKWALGNRFIDETVKGNFGGMEFVGHGLTGYDNMLKKYTGTWVDNMSTSIFTFQGDLKDGKTLTMTGDCMCPIENAKIQSRNVTTIHGPDAFEVAFYKTVGGKETKVMQITYARKK